MDCEQKVKITYLASLSVSSQQQQNPLRKDQIHRVRPNRLCKYAKFFFVFWMPLFTSRFLFTFLPAFTCLPLPACLCPFACLCSWASLFFCLSLFFAAYVDLPAFVHLHSLVHLPVFVLLSGVLRLTFYLIINNDKSSKRATPSPQHQNTQKAVKFYCSFGVLSFVLSFDNW